MLMVEGGVLECDEGKCKPVWGSRASRRLGLDSCDDRIR